MALGEGWVACLARPWQVEEDSAVLEMMIGLEVVLRPEMILYPGLVLELRLAFFLLGIFLPVRASDSVELALLGGLQSADDSEVFAY